MNPFKKTKKRARRHPGVTTARRTTDISGALTRCALACSAFILATGALSVSGAAAAMNDWTLMLVQAALTLLCFGLPAVHGLLHADDNLRSSLSVQALGPGQFRFAVLCGVLLVCPMTLADDLIAAILSRFGLETAVSAAIPDFALFLPMAVKSVLIAPICEELFFRGYFLAVLKAAGVKRLAFVTSLFFALVHGVNAMLLPRFALALLLYVLMKRTDSLLAAILIHAAYNLTILFLSFTGLGAMFTGLGIASSLLRIFGCAAFFVVLKDLFLSRGAHMPFKWGTALSDRQILMLIIALALLLIAPALLTFA